MFGLELGSRVWVRFKIGVLLILTQCNSSRLTLIVFRIRKVQKNLKNVNVKVNKNLKLTTIKYATETKLIKLQIACISNSRCLNSLR